MDRKSELLARWSKISLMISCGIMGMVSCGTTGMITILVSVGVERLAFETFEPFRVAGRGQMEAGRSQAQARCVQRLRIGAAARGSRVRSGENRLWFFRWSVMCECESTSLSHMCICSRSPVHCAHPLVLRVDRLGHRAATTGLITQRMPFTQNLHNFQEYTSLPSSR